MNDARSCAYSGDGALLFACCGAADVGAIALIHRQDWRAKEIRESA